MYRMKWLSERKVMTNEATTYFLRIFSDPRTTSINKPNERAMTKAMALFDERGKGTEMTPAKGTAFGPLNAITEFIDHERRALGADNRLEPAWFGQVAVLKEKSAGSSAYHDRLTIFIVRHRTRLLSAGLSPPSEKGCSCVEHGRTLGPDSVSAPCHTLGYALLLAGEDSCQVTF